MDKVRGKFTVTKVAVVSWSPSVRELTLQAEYDSTGIPEDEQYAKATPSGTITMLVDNPPAVEFLTLGQKFYVDFVPVPAK
jgi:hypothetical protein